MSTRNEKIIDKLNDLIQLDHDAIEAYDAAIERLNNRNVSQKLMEFRNDHERHTRNLSAQVSRLGGTPAHGPDIKRFLTKGKVVIADIVAADHTILAAMLANEEVTNKQYEAMLKTEGLDVEARDVVEKNLGDERRHRDWISRQMKVNQETTAQA